MATQAEVAAHLDLSDRMIRELIERDILPKAPRGCHDIDACRLTYVRHLRAMAAGRGAGPAVDDLTAERAGLAREQKISYALSNAAKRRELLPHAEITRAVAAAFGAVRSRLLGLPARLAGPLARLTDPADVRERLTAAIQGVLVELSEQRVVATGDEVEEPADDA